MTLVVCGLKLDDAFKNGKLKKYNIDILESECTHLDESNPVVIRFPEGIFYGRVTQDRIIDIIKDRADDLKIQTARLYDVDMEKYLSEPMYRKIVQAFHAFVKECDKWEKKSLKKALDDFYDNQSLPEETIKEAIKMALLRTTRGPHLDETLRAFGKTETLARLSHYLQNYKHRI